MTDRATRKKDDTAHADIGVVCALHLEVAPLLAECAKVRKYSGGSFTFRGGRYGAVRLAVVESGVGFEKARRATQAMIDAHTPPWVLSVGFSGALVESMQIGDIVVANEIVDQHGQSMSVDVAMQDDPDHGLHVGRIATTDEMLLAIADKQQCATATGAIAVDLESLAVAQVCRETQTRFMAVRAISDDMSEDLPPEILSVFGDTGFLRAGAVAGALWKRLSSAKDLWRLRENAVTASEKLEQFLDGVITTLAEAS